MIEKDFSNFGMEFQKSLIKIIIEDKKYGTAIIDVIDPNYFDGAYLKYLMQNIKELHVKYGSIPSYQELELKIKDEFEGSKNITLTVHLDTLEEIKNYVITGEINFYKDLALDFCRRQNLKKELKKVEKIIDKGQVKQFNEIEEIVRKALIAGVVSDDVRDPFIDIDEALQPNARKTIPTGIDGIDRLLKGGLAIGELGIILAPLGIGKTTLLTKIANSGYLDGKKVLHIIFEDNLIDILRKHYTIWTEIKPDDQPERKREVKEIIKDVEENCNGVIKVLKLPSASVTIGEIKTKLRKFHSEGFDPDLLIIDYVECISSEKIEYGEEWKSEGVIMRKIEAMSNEFNMAIWVGTQGNRESISSEVVTTDQIGGSIKKAQIGHVVISIGKTLIQKEENLATITLLKSRIGKDGIVFTNCKFDNELLNIDTDTHETILGHEEEKRQAKEKRAIEVYTAKKDKELKEALTTE
jgi:hypothetical protein